MSAPSEHWGVVGGGMLGLALARRLRGQGHRVTVLEAGGHLGGLASAWALGGVVWDKHYHVILASDAHVHRFLGEIGLAGEYVGKETKTGFYTDGKLYSMSNSVEFLRFPPLGLVGKLRLAATIVRASKIKDWSALERIPVVDWLTKWSGRRTVQKIWLPLLRSKLGESYKDTSAAFIWATIARMYAARRSGLKKEMFGYVRGGYARILDRLTEVLDASGVELVVNTRVARIDPTAAGVRVELAEGGDLFFDRVACTVPPPVAAQLLPALNPEERGQLSRLRYQGIVCASVVLKHPLDRFYVTNITDGEVPFTAVIEMTALVDPAELGGRHLVYLPKYVAADDPIFAEPDHVVRERFLAALGKMYPKFDPTDVLAFRVSRVRNVFPVPTIGYSANVPPVVTSLPGVYLVNSSQIVNGTLNVNETIQLAEKAAPVLLADRPGQRETKQSWFGNSKAVAK